MTKKTTEWYDVIKPTKEDFEKYAIKQLRIAKERLAEIAGYKEELAKELNISVPMVNKLMRQGMPRIKIGTAVRFELVEVVKWLKERDK